MAHYKIVGETEDDELAMFYIDIENDIWIKWDNEYHNCTKEYDFVIKSLQSEILDTDDVIVMLKYNHGHIIHTISDLIKLEKEVKKRLQKFSPPSPSLSPSINIFDGDCIIEI